MTELSVVVPVFNEAAVIEEIVLGVERDVRPLAASSELIVIDDCSSDETPAILDRLASERDWLHVEHSAKNAGHGPSVVRGLELATGDWIFQLDSDGQFVLADFAELWSRRTEADLVLGVRMKRRDPLHRRALSRLIAPVVSMLVGRRLRDPNVPFRLFKRELWMDLRPHIGATTLAPSILVAAGAVLRGWRVAEVPVRHLPRKRGKSSLRSLRLIAFSLRGLGQLLKFRRMLRESRTTESPEATPV